MPLMSHTDRDAAVARPTSTVRPVLSGIPAVTRLPRRFSPPAGWIGRHSPGLCGTVTLNRRPLRPMYGVIRRSPCITWPSEAPRAGQPSCIVHTHPRNCYHEETSGSRTSAVLRATPGYSRSPTRMWLRCCRPCRRLLVYGLGCMCGRLPRMVNPAFVHPAPPQVEEREGSR
jgi:hypothetical protein